MNPTEQYARVADGFDRALRGVSDWHTGTPCEEWDARQLAAHVVDVTRLFLARLDGSEPATLGPDADVVSAWESARTELEKALADHADEPVDSFGGKEPFGDVIGGVLCADTLLHTWDLARATGQDDTLDLSAVSKAQAFLQARADLMRRPGGFGPEVTVADDASPQDRLVAFAGRQP
ncbi:MAG: TIGR03086 family metal-binding protein [Mycobacteriales bacterium]